VHFLSPVSPSVQQPAIPCRSSLLTQELGTARLDGATRLDGARAKKQVWRPRAPMFEPKVFRKQKCCVEKSTCDIFGTYRRPTQSSGTKQRGLYSFHGTDLQNLRVW